LLSLNLILHGWYYSSLCVHPTRILKLSCIIITIKSFKRRYIRIILILFNNFFLRKFNLISIFYSVGLTSILRSLNNLWLLNLGRTWDWNCLILNRLIFNLCIIFYICLHFVRQSIYIFTV